MDRSKTKVAIVGGGPGGIVALRELVALGFDVTLFERRSDVGGVWTWTEDRSMTTALKQTRLCNSKYCLALGEVPITSDYPVFMSAPHMGSYLRSYAAHFELYKNIQFNKTVIRFEKGTGPSKWQLTFADEPDTPKPFDKVVWATGGFVNPRPVAFPGQEQFAGRILHSQEVRNMEDFKGQNVIILGLGNTAGDIAISLVPHAKKVHISHRRGAKLIKRSGPDGLPSDTMMTQTISSIVWWLEANAPSLFGMMMDGALDGNFKANWGENKTEWNFKAPSVADGFHLIVCNDDLIPLIKDGTITNLPGIKRIVGPKAVEMSDGSIVEDIDTIITAVGYGDDFGMLSDALTFVDAPGGASPLPNLYMGVFPPEHADSVAILSNVHLNGPQIPGRELAAMALAQVWAGNSKLPSRPEMDAWLVKHQQWIRKRIEKEPRLHRGEVPSGEWHRFMHEAAGTGLLESVGWSWKAWKLWWYDNELYQAVAHGPSSAHANRVFETGKRPAWNGARQALLDLNANYKALKNSTESERKEATKVIM